jgi:hypothetical protein
MSNASPSDLDRFLNQLAKKYPLFWPTVKQGLESNEELFREAGDTMIEWAKISLGDDYAGILAKGYAIYVTDINRSQMKYERAGEYANKTYDEVYKAVYDNRGAHGPVPLGGVRDQFRMGSPPANLPVLPG